VHFGSGEVIFRADEPLDDLHYLLSGEIGATRPRLGGQEDVVDVLLPVRPLCLPAVLLGLPAPIGARTLTGAHLISLPANQLRELIVGDPRLKGSVFDDVVRDAHELVVAHYTGRMRSVVQRLADYLFSLIKAPEEKPARFILPYNLELLAARFSCTMSGITNAFESLRAIGVQKQGGAVVVEDAAALKMLAHSSGRRSDSGRPRKLTVIHGGKGAPPPAKRAIVKNSRVAKPVCKVAGCEKPVHARGYCPAHYRLTLPICKVPGCTRRSHASGYCPGHRWRWKVHGDPTKGAPPRGLPLKQRLDDHTRRSDGCWEWTGPKDRDGYAKLSVNRKAMLAARLVYRLHHGDLPEGMIVRHKCGHRSCVNPEHLFLTPRAGRVPQE
jgi:CRP-like cAMP-binding protein